MGGTKKKSMSKMEMNERTGQDQITPYGVASQLNLRISLAKDLLEELEKKQLIKSVGGNARVRIYESPPAA
jgi:ribosomal protein S25